MKLCALSLNLLLACGYLAATPLKPGDTLPSMQGKTLTNATAELPKALGGKPAVIAFGFSREAGEVIRAWADRIGANAIVYQVPVLEGVPRLFRRFAEGAIKKDSGDKYRNSVLLLYSEEAQWRSRLEVQDEKTAYLVVVDNEGKVLERISGPPSDPSLERIRKAISSAAQLEAR